MTIKVGLHGMDKRAEERMLTVFKMMYKGQCEAAPISSADTVIIDVDDKNADDYINSFKNENPGKPYVVMGEAVTLTDGAPFIQKPAKIPELLDALKQTSKKDIGVGLSVGNKGAGASVAAASLGSRGMDKERRVTSTSIKEDVYYRPDKFLQGKVQGAVNRADSTKESVFIKCWSDRWIVINPGTDFLFENLKENQLRSLGLAQLGEDVVYTEDKFCEKAILELSKSPTNEVRITPRETFLWNLTARTARGRIPEGVSLDDWYVLQYWPNLTRLARIPNAMRICSFWLDQPQSINDVHSALGIPLEDVLTFFSAANAVGILTLAKRREDKLIKPEVKKIEGNKRGILAAIMRRMTKNTASDEENNDAA